MKISLGIMPRILQQPWPLSHSQSGSQRLGFGGHFSQCTEEILRDPVGRRQSWREPYLLVIA
jgi:hypothetical protein